MSEDEATTFLQCPGDVATSSFKILKSVRICLFCAAKNTTNLKIGEKWVYVRRNKKVKPRKLFGRVISVYSWKENSNGWSSATNLTKLAECLCESGTEIKEVELTKFETDHGNGTCSSTRKFFVYIFSVGFEKEKKLYCRCAPVTVHVRIL